jgi:O-methyltransferase domain
VISGTGRLLLIEPVIPPGNDPSFNKLLDMLMLVWNAGGRERTAGEHRALLASASFNLRRVIPTIAGVSIIEAVPV